MRYPIPKLSVVVVVALLSCGGLRPARCGTIYVVDENNRRVSNCYIYHENGKAERARVGTTDANGICPVKKGGKRGERYIAVSEEYNPASADCPVATAVIHVQRTTLLKAFVEKAEFFEAVGEPATAALQFRQAALIAEKNHDNAAFNALEYRVATSVAKVLQVEQPFVKTELRIAPSKDFKITLKEYQRSREMKPTGAVNSDTIRDMVAVETSTQPAGIRKAAAATTKKATGWHWSTKM